MTAKYIKLLIFNVALLSFVLIAVFAAYANDNNNAVLAPGWAGYTVENGIGTIGGKGGEEVTVSTFEEFSKVIGDDTPRIIKVKGTIDLGTGAMCWVGSNKTIEGINKNSGFIHGGFQVNYTQVIFRNLTISNAITSISDEDDAHGAKNTENDNINISGGTYIWIDHCTFNDGPYNYLDEDINQHDGLIDIKNGADYVTISNCVIENHNKVSLVGAGEGAKQQALDRGKLKVTYINNWFKDVEQRNPRVRYGSVHLQNNYYQNVTQYAVGLGVESRIYSENNYFESSVYRSWKDQTSNKYTIYDKDGNKVENSDIDKQGYYYDTGSIDNSPRKDSAPKANDISKVWVPENTEGYNYTEPMPAKYVKNYVKLHSGQFNADSFLQVDNKTNASVTQEKYNITGLVGIDCKLTITQNGEIIHASDKNEYNDFSINTSLDVGDNEIIVRAEAKDGTVQEYSFIVELKQFEVKFTAPNIKTGTYTAKAEIENNTDEKKDIIFVLAFYDNMGEMLKYTCVPGTVEANNGKLTLTASIENINSEDIKTITCEAETIVPRIKLFVWEGTDIESSNMLVYSKSYTAKL